MTVYIDTSALAKRYIQESGSEEFEAFCQSTEQVCVVGPLGSVELESILQRLLRQRLIDEDYALDVRRSFASDLASALWSMQAFDAACFARATELLRTPGTPLATLDALHLASAIEYGCNALATGDHQLARAAQASGLAVHLFA